MKVKGMKLGWIVVKDLQKAIDFYTNVVGLTIIQHTPEFGWAELSGEEGFVLGIAQEDESMKSGGNTIMTVTVDNIEKAIAHYQEHGAELIGEVIEVPGHVKMQSALDCDGNHFQLVEDLS